MHLDEVVHNMKENNLIYITTKAMFYTKIAKCKEMKVQVNEA